MVDPVCPYRKSLFLSSMLLANSAGCAGAGCRFGPSMVVAGFMPIVGLRWAAHLVVASLPGCALGHPCPPQSLGLPDPGSTYVRRAAQAQDGPKSRSTGCAGATLRLELLAPEPASVTKKSRPAHPAHLHTLHAVGSVLTLEHDARQTALNHRCLPCM